MVWVRLATNFAVGIEYSGQFSPLPSNTNSFRITPVNAEPGDIWLLEIAVARLNVNGFTLPARVHLVGSQPLWVGALSNIPTAPGGTGFVHLRCQPSTKVLSVNVDRWVP